MATELEVEISIVDILDYVGESVRPIREGHAVFAASHVVCIGYRKYEEAYIDVIAYVNQSSHPGLTPHTVELKICSDIEKWILKCSCKAGTAKCKHIIACLLHLERYRKLDYMSCTDVTQAWGITKSQKTAPWTAKRINDLCCVKIPQKLKYVENELEEHILSESFGRILSVSKESAISKHRNGRFLNNLKVYPNRALQAARTTQIDPFCSADELKMCLTDERNKINIVSCDSDTKAEYDYFDNYIKTGIEQSVTIAMETKNQNTNNWKIHRSIRITASSCYKLYTYIKNKNPDWDNKITQYCDLRTLNVKAVKHGKEAEPLAFNCYKIKRNPMMKQCGLVIHPYESWIGGSPDGLDPLMHIVLEIKCPGDANSSLDEILCSPSVKRYVKRCPIAGDLKLHSHHSYYCQVQINMWILNCDTCDFIIYSMKDDDFIVIEVPFDTHFVQAVVNDLKYLFFEKMLKKLLVLRKVSNESSV
ncbi:uncharacterized protein LOC131680531 [Topomyia yanbarensis]|uniref:uncharacterized protein LOC131680531 n=1 Tax=Topomyia yanbarensis TaxID=2498891 RepID=UPI00273C3385|nr:uncharacterized protein LOC131680531 [Topomyia yanbarensis]